MGKVRDWLLGLKTGASIRVLNDGKPMEVVTIRYKDFYFFVDIDVDSGKPTGGFGWSEDPTMNPTVPIRDIWTARPPERKRDV